LFYALKKQQQTTKAAVTGCEWIQHGFSFRQKTAFSVEQYLPSTRVKLTVPNGTQE